VLGDDGRKVPVLVKNAAMSGDRQRFNLAHELGHLVIRQKQTKEDEEIAHRFAAAFLVPDEAAVDSFSSLKYFGGIYGYL